MAGFATQVQGSPAFQKFESQHFLVELGLHAFPGRWIVVIANVKCDATVAIGSGAISCDRLPLIASGIRCGHDGNVQQRKRKHQQRSVE